MSNRFAILSAIGLAAILSSPAHARGPTTTLDLTTSTSSARGKAKVGLHSPSDGRFEVRLQRLEPNTDYDLVVGGIRVATLRSSSSGSIGTKFASNPRGRELLLGFDPRGQAIELRNAAGINVLAGNMPTAGDAAKVSCCVPDDSGSECEDRTADECTAQGGTVVAASSCLPDPCGGTPPTTTTTVCCVPDNSGPQCDNRGQADCVAASGSVVQATSCTTNPCAPPAQPADEHVQCCVAAYYVWACEDHTVAECTELRGINKGSGTCSPDPCGAVPPSNSHGICCLPNAAGDEIECEDVSASSCTASGGVVKSSAGGVCGPTTCADVIPPNPNVMCCLPNLAGDEIECEDRTQSDCATAGGVDKGAGVCGIDTCATVLPPNPDVPCCVPDSHGGLECEDLSQAQCAVAGGVSGGSGTCALTNPCGGGTGGHGGGH